MRHHENTDVSPARNETKKNAFTHSTHTVLMSKCLRWCRVASKMYAFCDKCWFSRIVLAMKYMIDVPVIVVKFLRRYMQLPIDQLQEFHLEKI